MAKNLIYEKNIKTQNSQLFDLTYSVMESLFSCFSSIPKTKKSTSKKNKLPLTLVQKWQQIKEEVEREEKANDEEEDEEDDPNVVAQKRIAQWKKEQMAV